MRRGLVRSIALALAGLLAGVGAASRPAAAAQAGEPLLARLRAQQAGAAVALPPQDGEDPLEIPAWFRGLLRRQLPGLPTSGLPQYPREALEVWRWLEGQPSATEDEALARIRALAPRVAGVAADNERRARYPKEWEASVPPGTALDRLRRELDGRVDLLPERDLEDRTPLPVWFRVHLRRQFPDLARSGAYQYPRTAGRILRRLLDHPESVEPGR